MSFVGSCSGAGVLQKAGLAGEGVASERLAGAVNGQTETGMVVVPASPWTLASLASPQAYL